jgi:hypothetical protein
MGGGGKRAHARDHRTRVTGETPNAARAARLFDTPPPQTIHQPQDAVQEHEVMRDEEASAEVRDVVRDAVRDVAQSVGDREGEGATREGGWLGMLGRARAALGRFVSAAPRTLRKIDRWIYLSIYLSIYLRTLLSLAPLVLDPISQFQSCSSTTSSAQAQHDEHQGGRHRAAVQD